MCRNSKPGSVDKNNPGMKCQYSFDVIKFHDTSYAKQHMGTVSLSQNISYRKLRKYSNEMFIRYRLLNILETGMRIRNSTW